MPSNLTRRRRLMWLVAICLAAAAPIWAQTSTATVPRVRLVATGGTISNRNGGRLTAEELVKSMPGVERYAPAARNKGVLVVLNDEINSAREVTKTDALRLQTFQARGYGMLGVVDADRVVFYREVVKRHTARSEFDVTSLTKLPRVDIIMVYQGADGDLIKAAANAGAQGIVIAAAGAGATSGTQREAENYAVKKGVIVVTTTR